MRIIKITEMIKKIPRSFVLFSCLAVSIIILPGCGGGGGGSSSNSGSGSVSGQSITDCYNCHADGLIAKFAGMNIFSSWKNSPHGNYEGAGYIGAPAYADLTTSCKGCHDERGDGELLYNYYISTGISFLGTVNRPLVGCESCHGSGDNHFGIGPIQYPAPGPGICLNCHDDSIHSTDTNRVITDSHYDDSSTTDIEGYNFNSANNTACTDCHNPHNADTTINMEWGNSSHGGFILQTTQDPVTLKHNVTVTEGPAWVYYDFKASNRQACQRCHTATGFKNFANNPSTYNAATNDFSYLSGNQKEMLYCWACHTSNVGDLRDPGQFSNTAPYSTPANRVTAVPDINGSNICMSCHSGRLNGQYIKDYSSSISGKNFGTFNSHYLADGGILYRTIGYEFSSLDYSNVAGFVHDSIGTANGTDGNNGPCAGCHMMSDGDHPDHTLEPLEKDISGQVTDIKTYNNVCSACHSSKSTLITTLNTRETQYNAALDELNTQLQSNGIYYGSGYPYFFSDSGLTTAFTAWPDKDTLGAAFNFNLLKHIPAAYAHNREYTRKLIYDSIDLLDDGSFNNSVLATVGAGDAYDYLNGTR